MQNTNFFLDEISEEVLVCDGSQFLGSVECSFCDFLNHEKKLFIIAEDLYNKNFDLSKYSIIAFSTMGVFENKFKKLITFDTSNLKKVIVLNDIAFYKIERLAKNLNIKLIGFNEYYWKMFIKAGEIKFHEKILFDPNKEWKL